VEIKIGVQDTAREISLDSNQTGDEVIASVEAAVAAGTLLRLVDDRGRTVLVPSEKITYVEIGAPSKGRVGFGS
jgi:hypothetical protein